MANQTPNVNFFLNYVETMRGHSSGEKNFKEHLEERRFYSGNKDDDYIKYVNKGSNEKINYVEYSGNLEKSHGVFGPNGLMNNTEIKELRNKLRVTDSPIWHGVISFTEDFGNKYCNTYEKAYKLMKTELPKFFKNAGLNPENTNNKHIHLSFFENSPLRARQASEKLYFSNGFIPIKAINKFKISTELKLLNITDEIILHRKTLTQSMKKNLELGEYMKCINSLMFVVPIDGRISYNSENMQPFQNKVKKVVNAIIRADKDLNDKFNDFEKFLLVRDVEIKNAYIKINVDYEDKLLHDKCMEDIYARLGNLVLYTIKDIRVEQNRIDRETKNRLTQKRIEKNKRKILLNKCLLLNNLVNKEIINAFEEFRYKLEQANYKRLQEEGILD